MDTPAGVVEDLLTYFSASHQAENELNKAASQSAQNQGQGSSSGKSSDPNSPANRIVAPKGLNPPKSQYKGFEIKEGGTRKVPPPPIRSKE